MAHHVVGGDMTRLRNPAHKLANLFRQERDRDVYLQADRLCAQAVEVDGEAEHLQVFAGAIA